MNVINGKDRVGMAVLVVLLLGGVWLAAAPFVVGYQAHSSHWAIGTTNEFGVGVGLVAVAAAGLLVFAGNALHSLTHRTEQQRATAPAAESNHDVTR